MPNGIPTIHPLGSHTYRTTFDLTGFDPATAVIAGCWTADNEGFNILINSVPTAQSAVGFAGWTPVTVAAQFLLPTLNDLDCQVFNNLGPSGLRVVRAAPGEPVKALLDGPASTVFGHSLAGQLAEDTEPAGKNAVHYARSTRGNDMAQVAAAAFRLPQPSTRPGIAGLRRVS